MSSKKEGWRARDQMFGGIPSRLPFEVPHDASRWLRKEPPSAWFKERSSTFEQALLSMEAGKAVAYEGTY